MLFFSRFPLLVWFVIIALITSVCVSFYTYNNVFHNQTEEIKKSELHRINQRMIQLQGTVNDFNRRNDYNAIHREVSRLSSDPAMGLIAISDEHGDIKYSSMIEYRDTRVKNIPDLYDTIIKNDKKNNLGQIEIIKDTSIIIGLYPLDNISHKANLNDEYFYSYLFARFDLSHTLKELHYRQQQELIQITLVHFTLLSGGFLLLYLSIRNRITLIMNGIRHFSDGDYDSRIKLSGNDEFSKISNGFDLMATKLQNQNQDLTDLTEQLQKQLARFKELSNLALTLTGDSQDVLNNISELISRLLEVKVVCLSEVRGDELYFRSVYVDGQISVNAGHCDLSITPCSTVEKDKDIRIYQQVAELFPEADFLKDNNAFSYCGFPALDSHGNVLAVTCLLDDKPHEFTEEDQDLLRIFGQRIGLELEHEQIQNKFMKQEEKLHLSQKMDALGKLTGGIAHDYNNMLGVIIGYAEMLENALSEQPKLAKYAHQIFHAGRRGSKLTKKLLSFSRHKSFEPNELNLNMLLRDQQHMLEKTLTVSIKLVLDLEENLWSVCLDHGDVEDAILNMCINALHSMEGNGQLTIRTRNEQLSEFDAQLLNVSAGEYVSLCITDTGCGMDEATKDKIFDPFYSTKGDKGSGLGLSQVYGFMGRSSGAIKVYSELGQGAQFVLYFPRYNESGCDDKSTPETQVTDLSGNEAILVVDDESVLLDLTCETLRQQGYIIHGTKSSKQALEILENEAIDLLLSDVIMPEMDGLQLASIVREKYPNIKIQLISGFAGDRHKGVVDDSLRQNILYKPFKSEDLLQRIRELLDEKAEQ